MYRRLVPFLLASQLIIAGAVNYSYDAAGRLITIDYGTGGSISYTYDNAGNVTSRNVQAGATAMVIASTKLLRAENGDARIEITGTNLAGDDSTVTIDGKPATVLSRCNATVNHGCRADRLTISASELGSSGKVQIVVTNGSVSSPAFLTRIH